MPGNGLIFQDANKAKDAILGLQKKEIQSYYKKWADDIGKQADKYAKKTTPSSSVSEKQMKELQKMMKHSSTEVGKLVSHKIQSNIYIVAESVVSSNKAWLKSLGFDNSIINIAFNHVPTDIVNKLITGQIYESGWSLSKRIWSDNEHTLKQVYEIVAGGVAQNKGIYSIAKDLQAYVNPDAAKPWNLKDKDGKKIYPKQVDYNAQRLARTLVQHGYQQSFVETTQNNPFITDYIWDANGPRVCPICIARDGKHFKKTELPMDHPNGMCTMVPNVKEDFVDDLAEWFNSPDGTFPEIDAFAKDLNYKSN